MKRALLFCSMFTLSLFAFAQDSTIALSKFELFYSQPNKLMKISSSELGYVGGHAFVKIKATDMKTGDSDSALTICPLSWEKLEILDNRFIYIPYNELDSLINTLKFFSSEIAKGNTPNPLYYNYITAGDINLKLVYTYRVFPSWSISFGRIYQHLRTSVPSASYYFSKRDITDLIAIMSKEATKM